jgi:hypothetical protein
MYLSIRQQIVTVYAKTYVFLRNSSILAQPFTGDAIRNQTTRQIQVCRRR